MFFWCYSLYVRYKIGIDGICADDCLCDENENRETIVENNDALRTWSIIFYITVCVNSEQLKLRVKRFVRFCVITLRCDVAQCPLHHSNLWSIDPVRAQMYNNIYITIALKCCDPRRINNNIVEIRKTMYTKYGY